MGAYFKKGCKMKTFYPFLILIVFSVGCVTPNPPRSLVDLAPTDSLEERKEQYEEYAFVPAEQTTVTSSSDSISVQQNNSLLAQDGNYYYLADYLPALQKEGIAKDVESTLPNAQRRQSALITVLAGTLPALIGVFYSSTLGEAGRAEEENCDISSPEYLACAERTAVIRDERHDQQMQAYMIGGGISSVIFTGALVWYWVENLAIVEKEKEAAKKRGKWARKWNKKLIQKLGLEIAPEGDNAE